MSAISQKSISGITSITSPAGTDDQISLHTSNTNEALKIDGAGNLHLNNHVNTTGVTTASNFKTGSSNLHSTGLTVGDSFVHSTGFNVGSNIKLGTTGIITATSFVGDGSDLTNLPAGLGTALSATASSPLNKMYYTNQVLGVPSSITVDVPASASKAYTQYADIKVDGSADLIVAEGDDLIPDVLGLADFGTFGGGASAGRIRVNSISNAANDGSPTVQKGLVVTGVCTATSFSGSGANLTSLPAQATIANNADNRVITGGSGVNLNGESNLIYNGTGLGVGETSPANLLHVKVSDAGIAPHGSAQIVLERSGTNYLQFLTAANGTSGLLFGDTNDIDVAKIVYDHNIPAMQFQTEGAERVRINADGDLLVGRTSTIDTSERLGIKGLGSDHCTFGITSAGNTQAGIIAFNDDDATFRGRIQYNHNGDSMQFNTAGSERLHITSDGKIGINQSSPDQALHITGNQTAIIRLENANAMGQDSIVGAVEFEKQDGSGAGAGLCGGMRCHSDDSYGARTYLAFSTRGNSTGSPATDTERFRIMAQGGVTFNGDTAYDNALDDYEEGSFTPVFYTQNSTLTAAYTSQDGKYTRIGNFVHFQIYLRLSSKSGGSGQLRINNLPFTSSSASGAAYGGAVVAYTYNWGGDKVDRLMIGSGSTQVQLFGGTSGGTNYNQGAGNLNNDTQLRIFGSYRV